jgi:TolB protein
MKIFLRSFFFLLVAASVSFAAERATVHVEKGVAEQIKISIEPFGGDPAAAKEVAGVLANDLVRSDWFSYVAGGAEVTVRGNVSGGTLNASVYQRGSSSPVLQKVCAGESGNLRSVAHQMADEIVRNIAHKPGIALTRIAFVANATGSKELYAMDYDGANVHRLTSDGSLAVRPRWGPNRRTLVFTSYRSGWPDIYLMRDIANPSPARLAYFPGLNTGGAISPDGRRVAMILSRDGNPELYVMDLGGSGLTRLTHTRQAESSPCWSPDGSQICFVSDRAGAPQLYIMPAAGGTERRLTMGGYKTEPDWATWSVDTTMPDLCYTSRMGKQFQVVAMNSRTAEEHVLTADGNDNEDPCWAPDGRHIVFAKSRQHRSSLYILDAFTGRTIEVNPSLHVLGDCSAPAWSR